MVVGSRKQQLASGPVGSALAGTLELHHRHVGAPPMAQPKPIKSHLQASIFLEGENSPLPLVDEDVMLYTSIVLTLIGVPHVELRQRLLAQC